MSKITALLKNEPVRVYEVLVAVLALVAVYVPDVPTAAILAFLVPVLGLGEVVRSKVTPTEQVFIDRRELEEEPVPFESADWTEA